MGVRGEQPLPGAPEKLLEATEDSRGSQSDCTQVDYLGVTVSVSANGRWRVHKITLDGPSRRVITELLDTGINWSRLCCSKESLVQTWAECLDTERRRA